MEIMRALNNSALFSHIPMGVLNAANFFALELYGSSWRFHGIIVISIIPCAKERGIIWVFSLCRRGYMESEMVQIF